MLGLNEGLKMKGSQNYILHIEPGARIWIAQRRPRVEANRTGLIKINRMIPYDILLYS